ncbi:MAG: hypothetical protein GIKADHBN_02531 [Phycisphaerales bacterium]|nr:hypothetical protein [Phycisphaerales bacterium]
MRTSFDWLVITAAGAAQAAGYRAQLAARRRAGRLSQFGRVMVVPDPLDRRAGSGISTLLVLAEIVRRLCAERGRGQADSAASVTEVLAGQRVLIIHSGGDSRRLPAFAAQGKVFAPLPIDDADGRQADLFDLVVEDSAAVRLPETGGVMVVAGDVFLGLRPAADGITSLVRDAFPSVVGVAFRTSPQTAARHGVYVLGRRGRVDRFLQKPTPERQKSAGAVDASGQVLVDTGVVCFDPQTAGRWLSNLGLTITATRRGAEARLAGLLAAAVDPRQSPPALDLYHHVLGALPARASARTYAREFARDRGDRPFHAELFKAFHGPAFVAAVMEACEFLHIGSTREMISLVTSDARLNHGPIAATGPRIYNSPRLAKPQSQATKKSSMPPPATAAVVEACDITRLSLGGENLVVGLPASLDGRVHLPRGWGISALPVGASSWASVLFGSRDDCKTSIDTGGTFGNAPLGDLIERGCPADAIWPTGGERTLWTARLWVVDAAPTAYSAVRWLADPRARAPRMWLHAARVSLSELVLEVNHDRLIAHRAELQRRERLARVAERVLSYRWLPASELAADCLTPAERATAVSAIEHAAQEAPPSETPRLLRAVAELSKGPAGRGALSRAFDAVAYAVHTDVKLPGRTPRAGILSDQVVWVTTPVRIDLAGGWSDTPPICHELGGSVVNMAITLNGQFPVQVIGRRTDRPELRLTSVDLGRSLTITSSRVAGDYSDPTDWAALPKAALVLSGLAPSRPAASLERWLGRFGGGIDLTVFSALPKGSGLGTSSVLGAAILACLDRVVGRELDVESIIRRTSVLEQMMSTAGGWQDQVGGITPGIKINRTRPGADQTPVTTAVDVPAGARVELTRRSLLYYTGQRRLARDILQKVVSRYLSRDREAVAIIHDLKSLAEETAAALAGGDINSFAACVSRNWEFKKRLDPGSTNEKVEAIIRPVSKYLSGYEMPGAGGGGFWYMIARDEDAARRVRRVLNDRPANGLARFFEFEIDQRGLGISVL